MNTLWVEANNTLTRAYIFPTFTAAMTFVNQVADIAQELQHHPHIEIDYTKVTLTLSTHDTGDIVTDKDRALATHIDTLN